LSSSISKIKTVKQTKSTDKTTALAADSKQDSLQPKISERHPIKTGADNYPYTYPFYKAKNSCRYESIRYCFNEDNKENLADNKMQTHLVDFY
jgi:hypothetical protein